ncbi:hypothetical protein C8J56DRAFT_1061328 [Mycena floridula]|nr:hypothetical protein C8J56DRAFT_1061328 [Mycena floridula]
MPMKMVRKKATKTENNVQDFLSQTPMVITNANHLPNPTSFIPSEADQRSRRAAELDECQDDVGSSRLASIPVSLPRFLVEGLVNFIYIWVVIILTACS